MLRIWDIRTIKEINSVDMGPYPANSVDYSKDGETVAVSSDEGVVKLYNTKL